MKDLLVQIHSVLTSGPALTAIIPPENIGAAVRQNTATPVLEYGISDDNADASGHREVSVAFTVYSQASPEEVYDIKEEVEKLMTAVKLTPVGGTFRVAQVRLDGGRVVSRTDWVTVLRFDYSIRVADARPRTQKQ